MRAETLLSTVLALILILTGCAQVEYRPERQMAYEDRIRLATIYIQSDQTDRARAVLAGAVQQEPERKEGHVLLGEVYFLLDDLENADRHFTTALDLGGDDPVVLNNLAWVRISRGRPDQARVLIDKALDLSPEPLYPYLDTRARVLSDLERTGEALETAERALSLAPEHDIKTRQELKTLIRELERRIEEEGEQFY